MNRVIKLPQRAWYDDTEIEIYFPPQWEVEFIPLPADEWPVLGTDDVAAACARPIGTAPLAELLVGRSKIGIAFDDLSRPTPVGQLVKPLLKAAEEAGIPDHNIVFICALGAHGAHTRIDFVKKLGEDIVARYPVYNHNPYENCRVLGQTSRGVPVALNAEFLSCDFKAAVGCILPHPFNGYGGGGKIIFPGLASIESIAASHTFAAMELFRSGTSPVANLGRFADNAMRREIEEVVRMAGLDFIINALVNSHRQVVGVWAGDPVAAHHAGVELAARAYHAHRVENARVVVVNANAKGCEAAIALYFAAMTLAPEGGDIVLIVHSPAGQITHYLLGAFGHTIGGKLCVRGSILPPTVRRIIVYSPYPDYAGMDWFGPRDKISWVPTWEAVLAELEKYHGGGTKVAVYVDGTMMYYR